MDECIRRVVTGTTTQANDGLREIIAEALNVWDNLETVCALGTAPCHATLAMTRLHELLRELTLAAATCSGPTEAVDAGCLGSAARDARSGAT